MSSLKKWLDEHPAAVAVGLVISVSSAASATTAYFLNQKNDIEKAEASREYKNQISDLTARLSSIERRAGAPLERKYLDVKSMQIPAQDVRSLPSDYKAIDGDRLFVSVPTTGEWTAAVVTEKEIMRLSPLRSIFDNLDANPNLQKLLSNQVYAWYMKPIAEVAFDIEQGAGKLRVNGVIAPNVFIQKISRAQMIETQRAAIAVMSDMFGQSRKKDEKVSADKLEAVKALEQAISDDANAKNENAQSRESVGDKSENYLRNKFEQIFESDMAGYVFVDALTKMMNHSLMSSNISFGINSAQKQFNVMYVDAEISFANVDISNSTDQFCQNGAGKSVSLRREVFFVSYPQDSYLIRTEVPTCGGRSAAFDWISQWLSGLRISVKA